MRARPAERGRGGARPGRRRLRRHLVEERHDGRDRDADDLRRRVAGGSRPRREHRGRRRAGAPRRRQREDRRLRRQQGRGLGRRRSTAAASSSRTTTSSADARTVTVSFNDGRHPKAVRATVIGTAAKRDLAIIRVGLGDLVPVPLGRSSRLRLGDGVHRDRLPARSRRRPDRDPGHRLRPRPHGSRRRTARISRGCCRPTPRSTRATPAGLWSTPPAG